MAEILTMKFLTLKNVQLGTLVDQTVVDLVKASQILDESLTTQTLLELVEAGETAIQAVGDLTEIAFAAKIACAPLTDTQILAPFPHPKRNIFCLGKNYLDHAKEMLGRVDQDDKLPTQMIIFTKATTTAIATGDIIPSYSHLTSKLDYEAELAIIIGKKGSNILPENAWDYVFGYTALNDVSARDLQSDHRQWFRGKSLDGFAPMGPVVVHRSIMPPPANIEICCWVNGEKRQQAKFDQVIFDVPAIISTLSAGMTLLPGDIIATGTPAGVGMGFNPPRFLTAGDEVVVEVTGVGKLINKVG